MRKISRSSTDSNAFTNPGRVAASLVMACVLATSSLAAHVALDSPNGGEVFEAGSVATVVWHDTVEHGPANYDLWYSVSGAEGPWLEIATDLQPSPDKSSHSFAWAVPHTTSQLVRVRVRQDNSGSDYSDISDAEFSIVPATAAATVTLEASHDATLYEGDGSEANGSGSYLFAGRTESQGGAAERRALIAFDVAGAVPAGATIVSASLEVTMSRTISGEHEVAIHRVLESWNEGPSDAPGQEGSGAPSLTGDVTWTHRSFPDAVWSTAGGSFVQGASASRAIGTTGGYSFASTGHMVADVQGWLDTPGSNFGWVLVIPEAATGSAKRFNSRENATPSSRPRLVVGFEEGSEAPVADFRFTPQHPAVGETVQFTDLSTGSPSSWEWDFGDGGSSQQQNPSHNFASAGEFTVALTVSNTGGSDSLMAAITVTAGEEPELSELVFIPAAANAPGSGGSFFVTTADVHNRGPQQASFAFLWLPRDTNNADPTRSGVFTLEPGATMRFHNLLDEVFDADGAAGAVAVISDSSELEVMSRTFNQTANGSFGQSLPGVPTTELIAAGDRVRVLFLTENEGFRSNLGLVNGVGVPIAVHWELYDSHGTFLRSGEKQLPAWGNAQLNRILADFAPVEAAYADLWTDSNGGAFTCYGSVLDQLSSDPTTVLPR